MALGTEVDLGPDGIVLDGDPDLLLKKGAEPPQIFGLCLLWKNGWIKMALGTEAGLSPENFVFDGDPAPSQ